jgi:mannose-6-phosphate isomerase
MHTLAPQRVGPNKVPVYYAGGAGIDRFRGMAQEGGPEDWVASVTAFPPHLLPPDGHPETGISKLLDGTSLREAMRADPEGWLGPALVAAFGTEPGLLVKLLDAGERLPVHCHPTRAFAREKLHSRFGKSEGWILLDVAPDARMWLGWKQEVSREQLQAWIAAQDINSMLAAMNRQDVQAGDVLYVPAGVVHAFGPGVLLIELQEPTSFSILAEYAVFGLTPEQATLGLSWDDALDCFDRTAYDEQRLTRLRPRPIFVRERDGSHVWRLFADETTPFFQAYRVLARGGTLPLEDIRGFAILIVTRGAGTLISDAGTVDLASGQTWVIPYAAGQLQLDGDLDAVFCMPPDVGSGT